jgi:hypothetical protein
MLLLHLSSLLVVLQQHILPTKLLGITMIAL